MGAEPTIYLGCSRRDTVWKDRLLAHLRVFAREGLLDVWDEDRIEPGCERERAVVAAIQAARVAVLLISADFLASEVIQNEQVLPLLRRQKETGMVLVPLLVRPCAWDTARWLGPMQLRPRGGLALSSGGEHEIEAELARLAAEIAGLASRVPQPCASSSSEPSRWSSRCWPCWAPSDGRYDHCFSWARH